MSKIKKVFLLFLFVFFLFQIFSVISINNSVFAESIIYGDINGDGEVNSIDYAILKKYLLGKIKEFDKPNAIKAADVDGNEEINSIDFAFMKKYLLGLIKVFPAYEKSTPTPLITATPTPTNSTPSEFAKLKPSITDVRMSELNRNSIELLWDQVEGAVLYEVLRDDVSIGTTSDTYFADLNVSEGMNHIYKIRAVNDLGESSQDSSNILVNTMDEVIDSNTVLSEDRYYINLSLEGGATLDLNGYALNVKGDFIQNRGNVNVNSGDLKVNGDYTIYEDGQLVMMNEGDYVGVGGDFIISNYDIKHSEGCLSEGVLEIKGDFVFESMLGYFSAGGNHKVVLSGDKEQAVKSNNGLGFNELEIRNEYGVKIETPIGINKMKGNYRVIGGMNLNYVGIVEGDVIVEGDLRLECPMLDLCGNRMVVLGSIIQGYEGPMVHVRINGGSIEVDGDYSMGPSAILEMMNEGDYVGVGGNFTMASNVDHSEYLTAGNLEVKGDFTQSNGPSNFAASGTHRTILSGDSVQTITFEYPGTSSFNILKLTKPINTGYIFNTSPVWKSLEE